MTKIIAIDFDSVLNKLLESWIEYLNNCYGLRKTIQDIKHWDMSKNYPELLEHEIYSPLYDPIFWSGVPLADNAKSVIKEMKKEGYTPIIVTDTSYKIIYFKWENCLLRKLGDIISVKDVIVTSQKFLIKCDYIIDDNPDNLKNNDATRILIGYPYNRNASENTFDYRCDNIKDAWECILKLEEYRRIKEKFGNV